MQICTEFTLILISVLVLLFQNDVIADTPECGNWELFKDELCVKILEVGLQNFAEAKQTCTATKATLVQIHDKEKQDFLSRYLFTKSRVGNDVWIGAKMVQSTPRFKWINGKDLTYTNWAVGNPKSTGESTCIQMFSDANLRGKWADESCTGRKNLVVCEKTQSWSIERLHREFIESKRVMTTQLEETKTQMASTQAQLTQTQKDCADTKTKLTSTQSKLSQIQHDEADMRTQLTNTQAQLSKIQNDLVATKNQFAGTNTNLANAQTEIANTRHQLEVTRNNLVPLGFIYTQLSNQPEPKTLWPAFKWTDITSQYAGVFFRAEGGDSARFGSVQEGNAPRVTYVKFHRTTTTDLWPTLQQLQVGGYGSGDGTYSGSWSPSAKDNIHYMLQFWTSDGEVRPKNMAMRVWKRSG